jgi:hypothetical protein
MENHVWIKLIKLFFIVLIKMIIDSFLDKLAVGIVCVAGIYYVGKENYQMIEKFQKRKNWKKLTWIDLVLFQGRMFLIGIQVDFLIQIIFQ